MRAAQGLRRGLAILATVLVAAPFAAGPLPDVVAVSYGPNGFGNDNSSRPSVSEDGRYLVFSSHADNLVPSDTNEQEDIFRKDLLTGEVVRVSEGINGQATESSHGPSISADGRYVAFWSWADNLVFNDLNQLPDVFRKDMLQGGIHLVSVTSAGVQANEHCTEPAISGDGRYIVFNSQATTLSPDKTDRGKADVFRWDFADKEIELVSKGPDGAGNADSVYPKISTDGRFVIFDSFATNLVSEDNKLAYEVFRKDMDTGEVALASIGLLGTPDNASYGGDVSPEGRYVVFSSAATNLVSDPPNDEYHVYRKDFSSGEVIRISKGPSGPGNNTSSRPTISGDGRFVAFQTLATNLAEGDTNGIADIYVKDLLLNTLVRGSMGIGMEPNAACRESAISGDGRFLAFTSAATNLVALEAPGTEQVYRRTLPAETGVLRLAMAAPVVIGAEGNAVTVSLTAPAPEGGMTVALTTNRPKLAWPALAQITIPEGARAKKVLVRTAAPTVPSAVATIFGKSVWGNAQASLTVLAPLGLRITPGSVNHGERATLTVSLARPAPVGGMAVTLTSSSPTVAWPALSTVVLPAGTRAKNVQIRTGVAGTATISGTCAVGKNTAMLLVK